LTTDEKLTVNRFLKAQADLGVSLQEALANWPCPRCNPPDPQ
jgi:hypothetical protein